MVPSCSRLMAYMVESSETGPEPSVRGPLKSELLYCGALRFLLVLQCLWLPPLVM